VRHHRLQRNLKFRLQFKIRGCRSPCIRANTDDFESVFAVLFIKLFQLGKNKVRRMCR
jgi:hypothetical protein